MSQELAWALGLIGEQTDKLPALLELTFLWAETRRHNCNGGETNTDRATGLGDISLAMKEEATSKFNHK